MSNIMISAYVWAQSLRSSVMEALKQESGQDLVEYAVLVGFIGIAAAAALILFMPGAMGNFTTAIGGCLAFDSTTCALP